MGPSRGSGVQNEPPQPSAALGSPCPGLRGERVPAVSRPARAGQDPASWHRPNRSWKDLREPARAKIPSSARRGRERPPLAKGCPWKPLP